MNAPTSRVVRQHLVCYRFAVALARAARIAGTLALLTIALGGSVHAIAADTGKATSPSPFSLRVVGDGIPDTLDTAAGDAARGRALIVARESANCILCHAISDPAVRFSGNVGPSLDGVGGRLSVAQLRLRVADSLRVNAKTIMPSYYRVEGLDRVASVYRGEPIFQPRQVEDIVAYLASLRSTPP